MSNRLYNKKHFWMQIEGSVASIGITDFLQEKLGTIMFINLPRVGEKITTNERFGDIESKKTVMDLEAPISGEVIEINEMIEDEPDVINDEPYKSWLLKIKISSMPDDLMNEEEYKERIHLPWMQNH